MITGSSSFSSCGPQFNRLPKRRRWKKKKLSLQYSTEKKLLWDKAFSVLSLFFKGQTWCRQFFFLRRGGRGSQQGQLIYLMDLGIMHTCTAFDTFIYIHFSSSSSFLIFAISFTYLYISFGLSIVSIRTIAELPRVLSLHVVMMINYCSWRGNKRHIYIYICNWFCSSISFILMLLSYYSSYIVAAARKRLEQGLWKARDNSSMIRYWFGNYGLRCCILAAARQCHKFIYRRRSRS